MNGEFLKPKRLKYGDCVRVIAPSSTFERGLLKRGIAKLENLGLKVLCRKDIFQKDGYLAGNDKRKVEEIHEAFFDKEVKAIFCARGGFGATRLLYKLDYNLISMNPKIFMGFSDITALNLAFLNSAGLATFHGPVLASHKFSVTPKPYLDFLRKAVFTTEPLIYGKSLGVKALAGGKVAGELVGGNLSIIHSMIGLKFLPSFNGRILFLEDIGEPIYKVERMLCHLFQLRLFDGLKGLVVGRFTDSGGKSNAADNKALSKLILNYFSVLRIPILSNFPAGHVKENCVLPLGCRAILNGDVGELVCEAGVSA